MNKYLLIATFLLASQSMCSAVELTLDYSVIQAHAAFGPLISSNSVLPTFPGNQSITGHQPYDGSIAHAQIDYEAVDSNKSATFGLEVDLQGTHTGPLHNSTAQVVAYINFDTTEPLVYSIAGNLDCITDLFDVQFEGYWELFGEGRYYYQEQKLEWDSSVLVTDDLPDPIFSNWSSDTTGILSPGSYSFTFVAELDTTNASGATANLTGLTNLTLTRLIPEPSSLTCFMALLCTLQFCCRVR